MILQSGICQITIINIVFAESEVRYINYYWIGNDVILQGLGIKGIIVQLGLLECEYVSYIILIGEKFWIIKYIINFL